jgi:hypothetical protein
MLSPNIPDTSSVVNLYSPFIYFIPNLLYIKGDCSLLLFRETAENISLLQFIVKE